MTAATDFRLYHSNALDVLAALLADELRKPVAGRGLLEPDLILIPQPAMRRWLQATLAKTHGVAANLEFLTPGEFVTRALDANLGKAPDALDVAGMQWALHAALQDPATLARAGMAQIAAYLAGAEPITPWALAGELARTFEKYQAWRGDWLLKWDAGAQPEDAQAILWRAATRGRAHRALRIDAYLRRFAGDGARPEGLPARLFVFATLNVSPDVLRVIATQARVGALHFYLPSPTREYWGDLQSQRAQLHNGVDPVAIAGDNALLRDWGAAGRDFMALLSGYRIVQPRVEIDAWPDPLDGVGALRDSLLHRMQSDLLRRRSADANDGGADPRCTPRAEVDRRDPSLQFHACHTRLRELQVLHDNLRALLDDDRFDPPLQPRDIAVLAPDIAPYLPGLAAVFDGQGHGLDYSVSDPGQGAGEPLSALFLRLLELPAARFGLQELLDLLASPVLAEATGLEADALDRLRTLLRDAGVRWGLDAEHRERLGAPRDACFTWQFALDRLLLGYASGSDAALAEVAPWPVLEGSALDGLDALLQVLQVLRRFTDACGKALPPAQWSRLLHGLLNDLLPERSASEATRGALERLRKAVSAFSAQAERANYDKAVPIQIVRAHFVAELEQTDARAPLLGGGVSFARMVPMRQLPFRVICLLGMNDGEFPRQDPAAGLNRLLAERGTGARRYGDRSTRDDDRFLFLQLFAAAQDVFYLSWIGADPRDGTACEPSLLVSELLQHAGGYHAQAQQARRELPIRHALQPFSAAAFGTADDPRQFSYRSDWHAAAVGLSGQRAPLPPWSAGAVPRPADEEAADGVSLRTLHTFFKAPAAWFVEKRLGIDLPRIEGVEDDVEPLQAPVDGIARHALQRAVFDALLDGASVDGLRADLGARGLLPSGALGQQVLQDMLELLSPYVEVFAPWRKAARPRVVPVELVVAGTPLRGELKDVYPHGIARLRFGQPSGPSVLRSGLDWLVAAANGLPQPVVDFHQDADGQVVCEPRDSLPQAQAQAALGALLALYRQGQTRPLPFAPYSGWKLFDAEDVAKGVAAASRQWRGNGNGGWAEGDVAALRLALRGRELFSDRALLGDFARIAGIVFGAVSRGAPAQLAIDGIALPECDDAEAAE